MEVPLENKTCTKCGAPALIKSVWCSACNAAQNKKVRQEWISLGLCSRCGGGRSADSKKKTCEDCAKYVKQHDKDRKVKNKNRAVEVGLCADGCGQKIQEGRALCSYHTGIKIWYKTGQDSRKRGYRSIAMPREEFAQWYAIHIKEVAGCCDWCKKAFDKKGPVTEHDHNTGEVRGLVCGRCNLAEGLGVERLRKIVAWFDQKEAQSSNCNSPQQVSSIFPTNNQE